MQLKEITVTISNDGSTSVEPTKGFTGPECLKETKSVEEALGKVDKRDPKPEMGQEVGVTDHTHVGG